MSRKEGKKEMSVICIEVVVKGTRGNEGAERSGVHGRRVVDHGLSLGDTAGGCVPGRHASFTFDTEATR